MSNSIFVTFRGEEKDVSFTTEGSIYNDHGDDPLVIEWGFTGLTPDQHKSLNITDAEDEEIQLACAQHYSETAGDDYNE